MDEGLSWLRKAEDDLVLAVEATNPGPEAGIDHGLNQDPDPNLPVDHDPLLLAGLELGPDPQNVEGRAPGLANVDPDRWKRKIRAPIRDQRLAVEAVLPKEVAPDPKPRT
jgi:hypothetical protein